MPLFPKGCPPSSHQKLNAKLFVPVLILVATPTLLINIATVFSIQPPTADILLHSNAIKNTDPSTAEYAKLMEEITREVQEVVIISIALSITAVTLSFPKQIVAFFAASTTYMYSGDRYSLAELISKVIIKGHRVKGPIITIAMVSALEFVCIATRHSRTLSTVALFVFLFVATSFSWSPWPCRWRIRSAPS